MQLSNYLITFLFGLSTGSFLNALIHRLYTGESILFTRSYCPKCKTKLKFLDLIPLFSFIFLKGRCRYCQEKISWQYPIVELSTALLFILVFLKYYTLNVIPYTLIFRDFFFISVLIVVFVYDFKHYIIPDQVIFYSLPFALAFNLYLKYPLKNLILASLIISGFFLVQFLISKGKWIGFGDVKLGLLLGVILSFPLILISLFLSYLIGALVSLILLALKKKKFKSEIPFGPFLAIATIIIILYGQQILNFYLNLTI